MFDSAVSNDEEEARDTGRLNSNAAVKEGRRRIRISRHFLCHVSSKIVEHGLVQAHHEELLRHSQTTVEPEVGNDNNINNINNNALLALLLSLFASLSTAHPQLLHHAPAIASYKTTAHSQVSGVLVVDSIRQGNWLDRTRQLRLVLPRQRTARCATLLSSPPDSATVMQQIQSFLVYNARWDSEYRETSAREREMERKTRLLRVSRLSCVSPDDGRTLRRRVRSAY